MKEAELLDGGGVPVRVESLDIGVHRPPEVVLEEARRAAKALKDIVDAKPKPVMFNGERYLEFEDWQTVGRFYGISPRITRTTYVEYGDVRGWEATADAIHVPTGNIISTAEAMCLTDEEKWNTRPKYEYHYVKKSGGLSVEDPGKDELVWEEKNGKRFPKKERVRVGDERVPLFQLRSMAQTRAGAKALRNGLAWVVVLAGYKPTPAEELPVQDGADDHDDAPPKVQVRADGSALVTGVDTKTGASKKGVAWTKYLVTFDDGRSGSTFDAKLAAQVTAAKESGELVVPLLEQSGQFTNLTGLAPAGGNGHEGNTLTQQDKTKLWAIAKEHGWTADEVTELIHKAGFESSDHIPRSRASEIANTLKERRKPEA